MNRNANWIAAIAATLMVILIGASTTSALEMDAPVARNRAWAERVFSDQADGALPFSFTYGGKASTEFIRGWKRGLKQEEPERTRLVRTLTLSDPAGGLEVRAVATIYTDTPGVDWTLYFTNRGDKDTPIIEQVKAVDALLGGAKADTPAVLHRLKGSMCAADDWLPFDEPLPANQRIDMTTGAGRSSSVSPFFNIDWGGEGAIVAIGWSGQWTARAQRDAAGKVSVQAGMAEMRLKLRPGETIRSPRILLLQWSGRDVWEAYNLFRRTMLAHIMPRLNGELIMPPIAHMSTSFYELNNTNEANTLAHLESVRGLGFEVFWLDAYWHGQGGFPTGQGNCGFPIERVEAPDRFPHGLKAIGAAVEKEGLKFLLWFEPERVAGGTLIAKEHPEWVLSPGKDGSGLFNLGIPEARKFMTDYLNAAVKAYRVTCLRFDYNIDPLGFWQYGDRQTPERVGMTEIRYVEGVYQMWDDIRKANPGLYIDDCASGGRRVDLETVSRALVLWRSDNTCDMVDLKPETVVFAALKNQVMSGGLNRYLPYSLVGQMGSTPYLFRSGFNGGIAFAEDVRPKDYPREQLKAAIAEGKRLQKYYRGNFYPLTAINLDNREWCVLQYHRPAEEDGMVVAFRRPECVNSAFTLSDLRGIETGANYQVTQSHDYTPSEPVIIKGGELKRMQIEIDAKASSVVIEYKRK